MLKLTSILSWKQEKPQATTTQVQDIARFLIAETKAGRPCWIRKVAMNADSIGHAGLAQISTSAARINHIRRHGVVVDGTQYRIADLQPSKCAYTGKLVEHFCLVAER